MVRIMTLENLVEDTAELLEHKLHMRQSMMWEILIGERKVHAYGPKEGDTDPEVRLARWKKKRG
jgi:hypothetical protein